MAEKRAAIVNKERARANRAARSSGAVGRDPLCYRVARRMLRPRAGASILDFGAGRVPVHTRRLRKAGFDATAYDFGDNATRHHDERALDRQYDIVIVSNVLNVQGSKRMLAKTLNEVAAAVCASGFAIANYPASPRYCDVGAAGIKRRFVRRGFAVTRIGGTAVAPVLLLQKRLK